MIARGTFASNFSIRDCNAGGRALCAGMPATDSQRRRKESEATGGQTPKPRDLGTLL